MVSGAGMMDFESCQSLEKLVIDAEIIGMARRLLAGIEVREEPIALSLIRKMGHRAEYLTEPHTLKWFRDEFYIPSEIIDRSSLDGWQKRGAKTTWQRAADRVDHLLSSYQPSLISDELRAELRSITTQAARKVGMEELPPLPDA